MKNDPFLDKFPCGIMVCKNDRYSTILSANAAAYSILGFTEQEMLLIHENRFSNLLVDDLEKMLGKVATATFGSGNILDYEYRILNKKGEIIWIHDIARYDKAEDVFYVTIMDISYKAKELEEKTELARKDSITNVLNQYGLEASISAKMEESSNSRAMFLINMDNFKNINELYTRVEGDVVLSQIAQKLTTLFESNAIIGRIRSDEFIVYLYDVSNYEVAKEAAQKINNTLNFKYRDLNLTCSVGVAWDEKAIFDFKTMCIMSDEALYTVKQSGKAHSQILT